MTISRLTVTPSAAVNAYQKAGAVSGDPAGASGFGSMVEQALGNAVSLGEDADAKATQAVVGGGDVTHVVTAISKAQLALQEIVSVRDKVVQSYQEVMRMSI